MHITSRHPRSTRTRGRMDLSVIKDTEMHVECWRHAERLRSHNKKKEGRGWRRIRFGSRKNAKYLVLSVWHILYMHSRNTIKTVVLVTWSEEKANLRVVRPSVLLIANKTKTGKGVSSESAKLLMEGLLQYMFWQWLVMCTYSKLSSTKFKKPKAKRFTQPDWLNTSLNRYVMRTTSMYQPWREMNMSGMRHLVVSCPVTSAKSTSKLNNKTE